MNVLSAECGEHSGERTFIQVSGRAKTKGFSEEKVGMSMGEQPSSSSIQSPQASEFGNGKLIK
jgi:hypothetical protein